MGKAEHPAADSAAEKVSAGRRRRTVPRATGLCSCYAFFVCIICLEFEKGRMTAKEARRALGEMVPTVGARHAEEVERALREAERKAGTSPRSP